MESLKTSDNKSNLLRYCTKEIERIYGSDIINALKNELNGVEDASRAPLDEIKGSIAKISKGIQLITTCLEKNLSKSHKNEEEEDEEDEGKDEGGDHENSTKAVTATAHEDINKNNQYVEKCFTNFLIYAEGVRDGLSSRYKLIEEEGVRIVHLFAENEKKISSSEIYNKLFLIIKLLIKSYNSNKRDIEINKKKEKRAQKNSEKQQQKDQSTKNSGGGVFEAHDLFQSGGANDIVARVRKRNMARQARNGDEEEENTDSYRPPPPPKPPPQLANRGSNS
jgi:hypothetical protein